MRDFRGKVAVVTGAASGIGRALAHQLNQAGAHLALCDLDREGLEQTREALSSQARISLHEVDVSSQEKMSQLAECVLSFHGQVDILINNAGISLTPTLFEDISEALFRRVMDVNMWGVYHGMRAFLAHLKDRPEASIVNVSSLAGLVGLYGYSPYAMSKFAVRGLSEALQTELIGTNVSVLVVHPGGVKTNIIHNAPDLTDAAQRDAAHSIFIRAAGVTPEKAARKILKAVKKKKKRIIFGVDAVIVNGVRWLLPARFHGALHAIFSRMRFK